MLDPGHELSTLLGEIVDAWGDVEIAVYQIFYNLLIFGCSKPFTDMDKVDQEELSRRVRDATRIQSKECHAIYYSVRSFKDQLDMMKNIAEEIYGDDPVVKKVPSLIKKIGSQSEIRNRIIHGRWSGVGHTAGDGSQVVEILRVMTIPSETDMVWVTVGRWPTDDRHSIRQSIRANKVFTKTRLLECRDAFKQLSYSLCYLRDELVGWVPK